MEGGEEEGRKGGGIKGRREFTVLNSIVLILPFIEERGVGLHQGLNAAGVGVTRCPVERGHLLNIHSCEVTFSWRGYIGLHVI